MAFRPPEQAAVINCEPFAKQSGVARTVGWPLLGWTAPRANIQLALADDTASLSALVIATVARFLVYSPLPR